MAICVGLGLFDGCFITVLGPIAFDLVGRAGASQAVGFLLALCSIPLTVGPMVSGHIIDMTGQYKYAFMYAGIPPFIGAILMIPILRGIRCRGGNAASVSGSVLPARTSFSSNEDGDSLTEKSRTREPVGGLKALHPSTQTSVSEMPGTPNNGVEVEEEALFSSTLLDKKEMKDISLVFVEENEAKVMRDPLSRDVAQDHHPRQTFFFETSCSESGSSQGSDCREDVMFDGYLTCNLKSGTISKGKAEEKKALESRARDLL